MTIPANYTFAATYNYDINGDAGGGLLTGTAFGGAAILGYALDLAHDDARWVDYSAVSNADSAQVGAVKFMIKPNYSAIPTGDKSFITICEADLVVNNNLSITHSGTTGEIIVGILDATGTPIVSATLPAWYPVLGQFYEFELDYDITTGATRLFIDGEQHGLTNISTGTRGTTIGLLRVGGTWDSIAPNTSNFTIDNLIIFNTVQHVANYTPGYCLGWADRDSPFKCTVYGFITDITSTDKPSMRVHVVASQAYNYGNNQIYSIDAETITNSTGGWELNLIENTTTNVPYTFSFYLNNTLLKQYTDVIVPNTTNCIAFTSLI